MLFDISNSAIKRLGDADLRILVAKLVEAEQRRHNLPLQGLSAGGDQRAPDGGSDVRLRLESLPNSVDFLPRAQTVFQVKAESMPPGKIKKEMCPRGPPRPVLRELAEVGGAYVLVSSRDSCADPQLSDRVAAMRDAVSALPNGAALALDFYDADRLALWARGHPGIILWIREQLGASISGWIGYRSWSQPDESTHAEYLIDDGLRLTLGRIDSEATHSIGDGITRFVISSALLALLSA